MTEANFNLVVNPFSSLMVSNYDDYACFSYVSHGWIKKHRELTWVPDVVLTVLAASFGVSVTG